MREAREIGQAVKTFLGLSYAPIGVKILTEDDGRPGDPLAERARFCPFHPHLLGEGTFILRPGDLACPSVDLILGFTRPRYVDVQPRIAGETKAVRLGPLEEADVVLFTLDANQAMALAVLLGGVEAECKGEIAVCGEALARAYNTGRPSLTLLCRGALDFGSFTKGELVVAVPYQDFLRLPQAMARYATLSQAAVDR